ncbi:DUF2332 domain-containing protein [Egicoccus halophilus]|uniref:DUF2332 domain-containing protein n=1 Tax=Egicoccus halophilus TaxID=1670830 RepID=A0A8J3EUB9_9ACTN|nr:DUF2332 domain-containing protein [Egicoccus halophilus]GGI06849.1 hypothetical protein GCM10011354_21150 [Egicoccus halophilus]
MGGPSDEGLGHDALAAGERLRRFASACEDRSPLYAHLARSAADDPDVAGLLTAAPSAPLGHPTLLFAAVHDLVLLGAAPALAAWYPSVGGTRTTTDGDPWPIFRATSLGQRSEVEHRIRTRRTQTNEVGRSSALLLALRAVEQQVGRPLAWLDVGTSAGLTLRADRFRHALVGDDGPASAAVLGPADATVRLTCRVGGDPPADRLPSLAWRAGLDAAPVDLTDDDARRWLQACVWPEQTDRLARLRAALQVAVDVPVPVTAGDAVTDLADAAAAAPADATLVVTHTWVLAYLDAAARQAFDAALAALGAERDVERIGMEDGGLLPGTRRDGVSRSFLGRTSWHGGRRRDQVLGTVDDHGRWLRWRPRPVDGAAAAGA